MQNLITKVATRNNNLSVVIPNKKIAIDFIESVFDTLYVTAGKPQQTNLLLNLRFNELQILFNELFKHSKHKPSWDNFGDELEELYRKSTLDAQTLFDNDPAATSIEEVYNTYPGFYAVALYRIANFFWRAEQKELARFFSEYVHSKTGIDIHPGATIDEGFAIDHGTGIVIGETTVIGKNVKIYQGVTLGAFNVSKNNVSKKRHPTIEDNVVIYSNATILGGNTTVGHDSIIGGNVWLTYSVPSNSVVFHQMEVKVKDNSPFPEPINFII